MGRRVVVIASGETERRALPELLRFLGDEEVDDLDIRIRRRHRDLTAEVVSQLIIAAWWQRRYLGTDKFVVVKDTDGKDPEAILQPLRTVVPPRLPDISVPVLYACAAWHLEAWFFADSEGLRGYLDRDLGSCDPSRPDEIVNPKLHLKQLLGEQVYTARTAEEIAARLEGREVLQRSPSFRGFVGAVRNGQ